MKGNWPDTSYADQECTSVGHAVCVSTERPMQSIISDKQQNLRLLQRFKFGRDVIFNAPRSMQCSMQLVLLHDSLPYRSSIFPVSRRKMG